MKRDMTGIYKIFVIVGTPQTILKKGATAMGSTPDHVRAFWDLASGRMQSLSPEGVDMVAALFVKRLARRRGP